MQYFKKTFFWFIVFAILGVEESFVLKFDQQFSVSEDVNIDLQGSNQD